MIVWLLVLLLGIVAFILLWRVAKLDGSALQMVAAGLCLALAGFAWQGRPTLAGKPSVGAVESEHTKVGGETFAVLRRQILGQFDQAGAWLTMSDALLAKGDSQDAVGILQSGIRAHPRDPELWIGLGNALFLHAGVVVTPAAELAFDRAQELAPGNPSPLFFHGLALAEEGRFAEAEQAWRQTLAQLPPGTSWRPLVEDRLQIVMQLRAMSEGNPPQPTEPPAQPQ